MNDLIGLKSQCLPPPSCSVNTRAYLNVSVGDAAGCCCRTFFCCCSMSVVVTTFIFDSQHTTASTYVYVYGVTNVAARCADTNSLSSVIISPDVRGQQ